MQRTVSKNWRELSDCTYSKLTGPDGFGTGRINYAVVETEKRAVFLGDNGHTMTMEIREVPAGSQVTIWAHAVFPGVARYEDGAWRAVSACL